MTKHIYIVVSCKTPKCRNICALKYLGLYEGQVEIAEMAPTGVQYQCGLCRKTHRYEREEMRTELFDWPPPPGWQNGWEP
jgi:hypothetical protein